MTIILAFRDAEFENIFNSSNNVFDSLQGDADNYVLMKANVTEWELNEVLFWHSFSCKETL